jgi:hypothetical protein
MLQIQFRLAAALLLCLALGSAGASDDVKPKGEKRDLESARAAMAKRVCKALTIAEPVEVKDVLYWKDGGSIGLELKDAKGTIHRFAWDGRAKQARTLFVGVTYPSEKEGKQVEIWGAEEQDLYAVLLRYVNRHAQKAALLDSSLKLDESKERLWEFREFFFRLDDRFRQMNDLPRQGK